MATPFHSACPGIHYAKTVMSRVIIKNRTCPQWNRQRTGSPLHAYKFICNGSYVLSRKYTDNVRWEINSYPLLSAIELEIINLFS